MPISADGWNANVTPTSLRYELDRGASHTLGLSAYDTIVV